MEAFGAWLGGAVYIVTIAGVLFWRFHSRRWSRIKIFAEEQDPAQGAPA